MAELRQEQYGYVLRKSLQELGMGIDENTLYPLLRRLETQGLLESQWREEDKHKKRYYRLSSHGAGMLDELLKEWRGINQAVERIVTHDELGRQAWN
jgi:PadR family transcriptional regulator PadR